MRVALSRVPFEPVVFAARGNFGGMCRDLVPGLPSAPNGRPRVRSFEVGTLESSVDDLGTGRGVVLGRAVATLRSVETQP